jgi:hypothetical protein
MVSSEMTCDNFARDFGERLYLVPDSSLQQRNSINSSANGLGIWTWCFGDPTIG